MLDEAITAPQRERSTPANARAKSACDDLRRSAAERARPVPPEKLCEELHIAVERAAAKSAESIKTLEAAVREFTTALQKDGATPEAILIALKGVINRKTFSSAGEHRSAEDLRQQISRWSIEEFFRAENA